MWKQVAALWQAIRLLTSSLAVCGSTRGDYFVRVDVRIPESLSAEEHRLYEKLWALKRKSD